MDPVCSGQGLSYFASTVGTGHDTAGLLGFLKEAFDAEEMARRAQLPKYIQAMNYVQGAKL
jgi:hypothetical protein